MGKKKNKRTNRNNRKNTPKQQYTHKSNAWDFLTHLTDVFYNVLTLRKISLLVIFAVAIITVVFAIKTPYEEFIRPFYDFTYQFIQLFHTSLFSLIIFVSLIISLIGNFIQRKYYKNEIDRMANEKKTIIHGLESETLQVLKKDNSSKISKLEAKSKELFSVKK